jgi:hypothetical protein
VVSIGGAAGGSSCKASRSTPAVTGLSEWTSGDGVDHSCPALCVARGRASSEGREAEYAGGQGRASVGSRLAAELVRVISGSELTRRWGLHRIAKLSRAP